MTAIHPDDHRLATLTIAGLETDPIRRHPDGTIDVGYYMQRGKQERSRAFYEAFKAAKGWFVRRVGNAGPSDHRAVLC